ncbi:uncharacterized protein Z519_12182 [Cladophialophora bantiana CBS 173.52]|uniref:Phenylacetyl-CoA ligase n=1 Tax=Cladophialophora bantiana (strain ATCC 10958 / CBS 173.52 / CDC B-1940 / NIH 8579) TaxID=1442370 RepID=A0A0D2HSC0_CLAB1|nr:uncharacterized protein Z519_12182 [Cladophialophora bantiana CBS 173.52]KIW87279.1 hypothetical protein Z519_12182 [Cladophialophora bantiana CBS 173.52]
MAIAKSPFPRLNIPEKDIFSFLFQREDRPFPEQHPIFQDADTDKIYTYADIKRMALDFGAGLKARFDWKKGDVITLFAANDIDSPGVILGTLWAGGVVTPANAGYTARELAYQLKDSGARVVATQYHCLQTAREACKTVGISEDCIVLLGQQRDPTGRVQHYTSIRNTSGATRYRRNKILPKTDIAFLVYSSGTTGKPKGVRLSHYNLISNVCQLQPGEQYNLTWDGSRTTADIPLPRAGAGGDKILACLPFFHIYGLTTTIHNPLYTGTTTIVLSKFEIEKWCSLVQKHSITFSYIVPPIVLLLCKHPAVSSYDLSSIRMTNSGAAPLSREMVESCFKRTGIRVKQGYGLSETSPTAFNQPWDDWNVTIGSVGQVLSNMEAKICVPVDLSSDECASSSASSDHHQDAAPLPFGTIGELHVRGPNIFMGYHNMPDATAGCLSPTGWFRTGDVGFLDPKGNLFITDRVKELIKYKGFQVAPAELESYLQEHPFVEDCGVVGVPSTALGTEVPRAYIVPKGRLTSLAAGGADRERAQAQAIVTWLNGRVANHKKLRGGVKFVAEIPKNASGKILRRIMKEWVRDEVINEPCSSVGAPRSKI